METPITELPDGSGCFTMSFPLPKNHWLYEEKDNIPPCSLAWVEEKFNIPPCEIENDIRTAAKYAIRASTRNGKDMDFDPDAMVQNIILGLMGSVTNLSPVRLENNEQQL